MFHDFCFVDMKMLFVTRMLFRKEGNSLCLQQVARVIKKH